MKLIHCSDLHLDSKMETNLTADKASERNREILGGFGRMVEYAVREGVGAVLISGDMFDTSRVTKKTADFILDTIKEAKEIDCFYLRGNHDESAKAFSGRKLPENLYMFSEKWKSYRRGQIVISGIEPVSEDYGEIYDMPELNCYDINIVMLHGQAASRTGRELIDISRLKDRFIDYIALGHLHSYRCEKLDARGEWCYSGCFEGRGFDECGSKGFVVLETENNIIRHEFVPFAQRQLYEIKTDISGLSTLSEIRRALETSAEGISERSLVSFVLTGSYRPDTQKDIKYFLSEMQRKFYFVKIRDESRLFIDKNDYRYDKTIKGEFVRTVLDSDYTDDQKDRIICMGIQALSGEEIVL